MRLEFTYYCLVVFTFILLIVKLFISMSNEAYETDHCVKPFVPSEYLKPPFVSMAVSPLRNTAPIDHSIIQDMFHIPYDLSDKMVEDLRQHLEPVVAGDIRVQLKTAVRATHLHYPDWMSKIDPGTNLTDIAIPGTHQSLMFTSCRNFLNSWVQTQDSDIYYQLTDGIRFFDFNIRFNDFPVDTTLIPFYDKFPSINPTNVTFNNSAEQIIKFIEQYPSEILMFYFSTDESAPLSEQFALHKSVIDKFKKYIIRPFVQVSPTEMINILPQTPIGKLREHGNIIMITTDDMYKFGESSNELLNYFYIDKYVGFPTNSSETMTTFKDYFRIMTEVYTLFYTPTAVLSVLQAYGHMRYWDIIKFFFTNRKAANVINEALQQGIETGVLVEPLNRKTFNVVLLNFYHVHNAHKYVIELNFKKKTK